MATGETDRKGQKMEVVATGETDLKGQKFVSACKKLDSGQWTGCTYETVESWDNIASGP